MQKLPILVLALVLFTGYTAVVVFRHGLFGFIDDHALGGWHLQIFIDLVIAVLAFFTLAVPDARRHGFSAWPYFFASLALGSIGVLAYLVRRELGARKTGQTGV
jgi:hypothetical protein